MSLKTGLAAAVISQIYTLPYTTDRSCWKTFFRAKISISQIRARHLEEGEFIWAKWTTPKSAHISICCFPSFDMANNNTSTPLGSSIRSRLIYGNEINSISNSMHIIQITFSRAFVITKDTGLKNLNGAQYNSCKYFCMQSITLPRSSYNLLALKKPPNISPDIMFGKSFKQMVANILCFTLFIRVL